MATKLYNRNICWDDRFDADVCLKILDYSMKGLKYSRHYVESMCYRYIKKRVTTEYLLSGTVVEVEVDNDNIEKAVIRNKYDERFDLITVIRFVSDGILFVTSWINNAKNNHDTLDTTQYELIL